MKLWVRITLAVTLMIVLTAGSLSIFVNHQFKINLTSAQNEWSHILSQSISQSVMGYTIEENSRKTQDILRRIKKESRDIEYIMIVDFNNKVFASTLDLSKIPEGLKNIDHSKCRHIASHENYHSEAGKIVSSYFGGKVLDHTHPLIHNLDAHIHLGFRNAMLNNIVSAVKKYSIWITVFISLIGFFVAFVLARKFSRPIENLSDAVTIYGKTGNYKKQTAETSDKDIVKLQESFESMFDERSKFEKEISEYKDNLEKLVEERTKRLEEEIVKHKETEKNLIKEKEISDKASRTKSDFLSHMSHELRTPLNAIMGFSQLLEMNNDDEVKNFSGEIKHAGRHLLSLINDVLDLSKVEAGKLIVSVEEVNINEVIAECHWLLDNLIKEKNINLSLNYPADKDFIVFVDRIRLKQAILNLISNAVKYNDNSGSVIIALEIKNEVLRISIKDTGKGIPAEKQDKLFVPFQRLDMEKSAIDGVGIGLVITKALVERMNGKIGFTSEYNLGSLFWMEFPFVRVDNKTSPFSIADENTTENKMTSEELTAVQGKKTVLYLEDNPSNMKMVENLFKKYSNIELLAAVNPSDAFLILQKTVPDLILLDINLPEMSGYEFKRILDDTPEFKSIKIVGLSANAMQHDIDKARSAGFVHYIAKPIDIKEFMSVIEDVLSDS